MIVCCSGVEACQRVNASQWVSLAVSDLGCDRLETKLMVKLLNCEVGGWILLWFSLQRVCSDDNIHTGCD